MDHYSALELTSGTKATTYEIKAAMQKIAGRYSEVPGTQGQLKVLRGQRALATLSDPIRRQAYDKIYNKVKAAAGAKNADGKSTQSDHYKTLGIDKTRLDTMSEQTIDNYIVSQYFQKRGELEVKRAEVLSTREKNAVGKEIETLDIAAEVLRDPYKRNEYNNETLPSTSEAASAVLYDHRSGGTSETP